MAQVQTGFDPQLQQDVPQDEARNPRNTRALFLLLLLAAAGGAWWMNSRGDVAADTTPDAAAAPSLQTGALPAPVNEPASPARRTAAVATTRPAPVASRDRSPQLLAGSRVIPKYPTSALRAGDTGTVQVVATIDANGVPVDVSIDGRSGNRDLDRAAVNAVRKWRFAPATRNGKPVDGLVRVPVEFALAQR